MTMLSESRILSKLILLIKSQKWKVNKLGNPFPFSLTLLISSLTLGGTVDGINLLWRASLYFTGFINIFMSFKLSVEQITALFNPDNIHRGVSIERLHKLGKIPALEGLLRTNFKKGLLNNPKDHVLRRQVYGSNAKVVRYNRTFFQIISKHFEDQLIRLLAAAGFASLCLGIISEGLKWGWVEGFSIFLAVALVVGVTSIDDFLHEREFEMIKGEEKNADLRVYRGGKLYMIPQQELMVGDVIEIMSNDRIEVDGILLVGEDLTIDQSQITGQANEIKKRVPLTYQRQEGADPFILSSSTVMHGMGIMLVMAVGRNSYYGNLLSKIHEDHVDSPLKLKITDLSDHINDSSMFVGILTFSSLILHYLYQCFQHQDPLGAFISIQTLHKVVEAILVTFTIDVAMPESLPLSVTFSLAHSVKQLASSHIFVKHLNDAETMGGIDCLCLTKTGFITKNLLSVTEIFVEDRITNIISREAMSQDTCRILNLGIIMNTIATPKFIEENGKILKIEHIGNKTESALLEMAYRMGFNYERFRISSRVKKIYSSGRVRRKMATIYRDDSGKLYLFVKGATSFILPYCSYHINRYQQIQQINLSAKAKIQQAINHFSQSNLRTLTLAYKEVNSIPNKWSQVEKNLILIAIVGIKDIIRKGVKPVIQECRNKGINVRMLSNEGRYNAIGTAKEAGILGSDWVEKDIDYTLVEGCDFRSLVGGLVRQEQKERQMALDNFKVIKDSLKVIYRATEEDKYLLNEGLKQCGHVVAVAGNGTNDIEAMRKADISLTMAGTANNSAKEASDIIFFNDNFASILQTVKWGRHVFNSVKKFLVLQLTINLVAAAVTLLGAVFLGEGPLHPLQMLWTNLLIEVIGSIAIILETPKECEIKLPYSRRDKILTHQMLKTICFQALVQVAFLSIILFRGPDLLDIPTSVEVQVWSEETAIHYSIFFNTFVMFQIFNQFNVRQLNADKLNIFAGLFERPLFLCFIISSFALQFSAMRYGGRLLHVTELSFKNNLFCFVVGSISLYWDFIVKIVAPAKFIISSQGIEIGKLKFEFKQRKVTDTKTMADSDNLLPPEPNFQLMSLQFCSFLVKKKTKNHMYSYMDPMQTLKSYESDESSLQDPNPSDEKDNK